MSSVETIGEAHELGVISRSNTNSLDRSDTKVKYWYVEKTLIRNRSVYLQLPLGWTKPHDHTNPEVSKVYGFFIRLDIFCIYKATEYEEKFI
jgi:hypothetical protein